MRNAITAGLIWLTLALPCGTATAETNNSPATPGRYLLIMDTSSPMRSRARAAEASIAALLDSGFQGEIRTGDQLGIWTFNNDLHTGEFELVTWDDSARQEISRHVQAFLDKQRFRKPTDFSKVMPHLMAVVEASKRITVILVSDGDEVIQGTPFDDAIAGYYREHAETIKDQRAPILTVLRGYEGRIIGHSVSYPPWPVEFPAFPPEPEPEPEPQPKPEPKAEQAPVEANGTFGPRDLSSTLMKTNRGPIVYAQPLIVSGASKGDRPVSNAQGATNEIPESTNTAAETLAQSTVASATSTLADHSPETAQDPESLGTDREARPVWRAYLAILALVVVGLGGVIMWLMRTRQPRSTRHASLITRSMGSKKAPEKPTDHHQIH